MQPSSYSKVWMMFIYGLAVLALTGASLETTHLGASTLLPGSVLGGWALAIGIQLLIVIGGYAMSLALRRLRARPWGAFSLLWVGAALGIVGVGMSAATSYANYRSVISNLRLQSTVNLAIEALERDYQVKYDARMRQGLANMKLAVEAAYREYRFWLHERDLQNSESSPNLKGTGPRWVLADQEAERQADFIYRLTGARPATEDGDTSDAGQLRDGVPPLQVMEENVRKLPEKISLRPEVSHIEHPLSRFLAAYDLYKGRLDALSALIARMPTPEALQLPALRQEFEGKPFGQRVHFVIDGKEVSNIPVPPERPKFAAVEASELVTPASYEALGRSIIAFQMAEGLSAQQAQAIARDELSELGDHPWLVGASRLIHPSIIEWVSLVPALATDLAVLLLGLVYGLAISVMPSEKDEDNIVVSADWEDELRKMEEECFGERQDFAMEEDPAEIFRVPQERRMP